MGIRVVLPDIMTVLLNWFMGSEFLQPDLEIMVKPCFVIVDEYRGSDMHRINQQQPLFYATLLETGLNLRGDID
jgi:hypothetical protein